MCFKWIEYKGAKILYQDLPGGGLADVAQLEREFVTIREIILAQPLNSVRVLTNFQASYFSKDLLDVMVNHSRLTAPYIKKMAAVGVNGPKRIMTGMVERLSGQSMTLFDNAQTAQEWLANG